jgi:hypothetical protein
MHAIQLAVTIGIEFRGDPQIVADPEIGILELRDDLRLTIDNDRHCGHFALQVCAIAAEQYREQRETQGLEVAVAKAIG